MGLPGQASDEWVRANIKTQRDPQPGRRHLPKSERQERPHWWAVERFMGIDDEGIEIEDR
jgi:hypothetical protein